jgi:type IX secretion system PorP/SprF family membrane protein
LPAKLKYALIVLLVVSIRSNGQDPTFSQFYANSLYLAPSFAGSTEDFRFGINYRNQWPAIPGVFHTYSIAFDRYMPNFSSGIGVLATYDVAGSGDLSTTNVGLIYSYDFRISQDWHVRPGVQFKFQYLGLNIYKLIFNSSLSPGGVTPPIIPPPFESVADFDFTFSSIIYNDRIWAGVTLDHLLRPKQSFYGDESFVPVKINVFGGAQLVAKGRQRKKYEEILSVAGNFQMQGGFVQSDLGLYYYRDPIMFGLWYRGIPFVTSQAGDAIIGLIGFKTDDLHIGYSYDFTISNLIASTAGAHEISIVYKFTSMSIGQRSRFRAIPCPQF